MAHAHIRKLDHVHCRSELIARALVCKRSIYMGDMVLKYNGQLKAFKLKPNHVPVSLEGITGVIQNATCQDYLIAGQEHGSHYHIEEIFATHNRHLDFDELEIGASSWQPKLDALQEQIDALDSTYAQDAEVVAAFAEQIAASGDVFALVTNKVAVETTRATQAEQAVQDDVDSVEAAALADRQAVRDEFIAADVVVNNALVAEASRAQQAEGLIQADVDANESAATADRQDIRADFAAGDVTVNDALVAEAALARANEGTNAIAIAAEKSRIDVIVNLSPESLNNFAAIENAYQAADGVVSSALSSIITTKVAAGDLDTLVAAVDEVEANTLKRSNADNDTRYYQKSEVDTAVGTRVLQTDFDTAIAARQTTAVQESTYRKIADSYLKSEVDTAVGTRVLQTDFDTAIGARQTTAVQEATYRKINDSYLKSEVDSAVGLRVLQTAFDTAIGDRQTTAVQEATYRKIDDSYTKAETDAADSLRVLQTAFDSAIGDRQTTAVQEATYRKIADSYTKAETYTQTEADAAFYGRTHVDTQLATKQAVVGDDHLQISHTTGLSAALTGKQASIGNDDLDIAHTSGLTAALASKQSTIGNDDLTIAHTSGLQTALDGKGSAATVASHATTLGAAEATAGAGNTPGSIALYNANGHIAKAATVADISGHTVQGTSIVGPYRSAPATATSSGVAGEIRADVNYIYVCVGTNLWRRTSSGTAW